MRHYKNIKLIEDGFTAEYFERRKRESRARAERWIESTRTYERKNPILTTSILVLLSTVPVPLLVMVFRGMIK